MTEGTSNRELRSEKVMGSDLWTGVQFPTPPPKKTYANTILEANEKFAVFGNAFGIMVCLSDYDTETHIQTKKATYKDIL